MLVCGRYRITVEAAGRRQWFRLWLGSSLLADNVGSVEELERELARYGLTLAEFQPEPGDDEEAPRQPGPA